MAATATAMPRASRSMVLSFGMFNVPVAIAPMFKSDDGAPKGHKHCVEHHGQVKQAWFCEHGEHYVSGHEIETAYEYAGKRTVLSSSEIVALESDSDGVVTLKRSCLVSDIDPSYYEKTYLVWPQAGAQYGQAYLALAAAMRNMDTALIGQVVVSKTDRMLVLRWSAEHGCMVGHICNFAANLKHEAIQILNDAEWTEPSPEFVGQAEMLIGALLGEFDPGMVEDTYAARLEARLGSPALITTAVAQVNEESTPNMMEVLAASILAANTEGAPA